jgi:hypothetical protein
MRRLLKWAWKTVLYGLIVFSALVSALYFISAIASYNDAVDWRTKFQGYPVVDSWNPDGSPIYEHSYSDRIAWYEADLCDAIAFAIPPVFYTAYLILKSRRKLNPIPI